jgi:hypothetical protein
MNDLEPYHQGWKDGREILMQWAHANCAENWPGEAQVNLKKLEAYVKGDS